MNIDWNKFNIDCDNNVIDISDDIRLEFEIIIEMYKLSNYDYYFSKLKGTALLNQYTKVHFILGKMITDVYKPLENIKKYDLNNDLHIKFLISQTMVLKGIMKLLKPLLFFNEYWSDLYPCDLKNLDLFIYQICGFRLLDKLNKCHWIKYDNQPVFYKVYEIKEIPFVIATASESEICNLWNDNLAKNTNFPLVVKAVTKEIREEFYNAAVKANKAGLLKPDLYKYEEGKLNPDDYSESVYEWAAQQKAISDLRKFKLSGVINSI